MKTTILPKLDKPGAGLPFGQMLFLKLWLGPVVSRRTPPAKCRESYELLVAKTIEKASAVPPERRGVRVLVNPIAGLEDSSRYWSLNEVFEHLLIVSKATESVIYSLASGQIPPHKADTAAVKPRGANEDHLEEFRAYAPGLLRRIDQKLSQPGMNRDSSVRFRHPWFGPLTARQWYWLVGTHVGIHYRQAKEIIAGLDAASR